MKELAPSKNVMPPVSGVLTDTEVTNRSIWINDTYTIPQCHALAYDLVKRNRDIAARYIRQAASRKKLHGVLAIILGSFAKQVSLGYLRKEFLAIPTGNSSETAFKATGYSGKWLANGVNFLIEASLVEIAYQHFYNRNISEGRIAKYKATAELIELLEDFDLLRLNYPKATAFRVSDGPVEAIIKHSKNNYLSVDNDPSVEVLEWLARRLSKTRITIAGVSYAALKQSFDYNNACSKVAVGQSTLVRKYIRDLDSGGRIYCYPLQSVPKQLRQYLRYDGVKTVELDYRSMHLFLLYRHNDLMLDYGAYPNNDPYDVGEKYGLDRNDIKSCFTTALGEKSLDSFLNHTKHHGIQHAGFSANDRERALTCLIDAHPLLSKCLFQRNLSLKLQKADSEVALDVLARLKNLDVPCLPVHESFIVKRAHEGVLRAAMTEALPGALVV